MKTIVLLISISICCLSFAIGARRDPASSTTASDGKIVAIVNFQFTPKTITVKAGGSVTWVDKEGTHTVTADDNSWESPTLKPGQVFKRQFTEPGSYPYHCSFHGSPGGDMSGVVRVVR